MSFELNYLSSHLPKNIDELAERISAVQLWPWLLCVHYLLVAISMRGRAGSRDYAVEHPFASCFVCVTSCFGGRLLMNLLMGYPLVQIYTNANTLLLATLVWYLIFFSPGDFVYKLVNVKVVRAVLLVLKEIHRIHGIRDGGQVAAKVYKSYFAQVLMGSVRGSGAKFVLRPLDCFVRGNIAADNEFLRPAFSTKHAVISSFVLLLHREGYITLFKEPMLLLLLTTLAVLTQLFLLFTSSRGPYANLESLFCWLFLSVGDEPKKEKLKKQ